MVSLVGNVKVMSEESGSVSITKDAVKRTETRHERRDTQRYLTVPPNSAVSVIAPRLLQ